jgi:hypothetical protein
MEMSMVLVALVVTAVAAPQAAAAEVSQDNILPQIVQLQRVQIQLCGVKALQQVMLIIMVEVGQVVRLVMQVMDMVLAVAVAAAVAADSPLTVYTYMPIGKLPKFQTGLLELC